MIKEIEELFLKYEHLKVGKIDSSTDLDKVILTDDWTYRKGNKEVVITYEMRHHDIAGCEKLLETLEE